MAKKKSKKNKRRTASPASEHPKTADLFSQGFAHYQAGRLKEAEDYCRVVLASDQHHPDALHLLGMTRHQQSDDLNAIDFIQKAIAIAPDNFFYHLNLGNIYFSRKNHPEAGICYQKALELNPGFVPTIIHTALNLEQNQRHQEAISYYRKALTIEPDNSSVLTGLGNALLAAGMIEESIATLRKLVAAGSDRAESYYNLGGALMRFGDLDDAAEQYRKALQLSPDFVDAYCNLGIILAEQGRVEAAIKSLSKALALKPDYPEIRTHLAIISWITGDWKTCRNHLDHISGTKEISVDKDVKFVAPYRDFLGRLLDYRESHADRYTKDKKLPLLYVVGDSHCLSTAKTKVNFKGVDYLAEAKIVIGCKAWHLGNNDNNRYKYEFEKKVASIPAGAALTLMFGEIDCRHDEGIIKHYKKTNVNLETAITGLVDNYLEYILRILKPREISPIISNVNMQLIESGDVSDTDKKLQEKILKIFNQALERKASKEQIPLLDVYTFSKTRKEGSARGCHIDRYHLRPSVFGHLIKKL